MRTFLLTVLACAGILSIAPLCILLLFWGQWAGLRRALRQYGVQVAILVVPAVVIGVAAALLRMAE